MVTLTTFDAVGVQFEAIGSTELYRILSRGDEEEYIRQMLTALKSTDVLFDIGANIGLVALHAAGRCRTVAFEPDPDFRARLERNASLNHAISLDVLPVAISDRDGTVTLYSDGADGNSPSLVHQRHEGRALNVEARSLDSLLATVRLPAPTVVKLDIEGAEILALRGASRLLNGPSPPRALFLELHDAYLPGFNSSTAEVLEIVRRAGYRDVVYDAMRHDQRHLILARD